MATEILRPIGVGDRTDILHQYPASDAHWDKVNEVVADEDARYVFHNADLGDPPVMTGDLYALEDSAIGAGTINSVTVTVRGRGVGPDQQWIQTYIKTVATEYTGTQTALTTSYADYSTVYTTNPNTGASWTWAQINALQAGGRICASSGGAGREARKTQVWVVVDYTVTSQTIYPSSIVQPISIGTPALLYPQTLLPSSVIQAIAYGTPMLLTLFIKPSSIVQAIAIGTPTVKLPQLFESYTEESAYYNVYGEYWRSQTFTPQSSHKITSVKLKLCRVGSPGTGTVSIKATDANGKPTGADLCSGSIDGNALPETPEKLGFLLGAGANLSTGTKYAIVWRFPSGDSSNYARTRHMYPGTYAGGTAVTSSDSGATWSVVTDWDFVFEDWGESLLQTISPESTVQPIAYGTPEVSIWGILKPTSIVQQIVVGVPTVEGGIPGGFVILPQSIVQPISIGSPTILKYVWHVVLDGQYNIESPAVNRAYVIGRDIYGNPVYGTAVDSTELGLVGERLDFQQDPAIPTEAKAADVANAILAKMRLTGKRGVILIPPNCGQELFDVVQITDAGANQSAVKFRVVGIRFEYNPKQARYHHKLILGAP